MIYKKTDANSDKRDISVDSEAGVGAPLKPDAFLLCSNFEMFFFPPKPMGILIVSKLLVYNPLFQLFFYIF